MSMNRHQLFEELISASLADDLSDAERSQLDAHLDGCAACRATLASFAEQRRIMAGLRHAAAPRDLGARVRAGVERGAFVALPWWRRPAIMFGGLGGGLAAVAGALLAIVFLNGSVDDPQVGDASPTAALPSLSPDAFASGPQLTSPSPGASAASPDPSGTPNPTPPASIGFGAINYLQWEGTLATQSLTLHGWDPATETSSQLLDLDFPGQPAGATLSPNGSWLAYQISNAGTGTNRVIAVELMTGASFEIGETPDGSPFSRRMTWSPDSRYLAYTSADVEAGIGPDAWVYDTSDQTWSQLTDSESTYAASFVPRGEDAGALLVSQAGEAPVTYALSPEDIEAGTRPDPATVEGAIEFVFQPILSPSGEHAIFWRGTMRQPDVGWEIAEGGMLYLSGEPVDGSPSWSGEPLFATLPVDRDALGSAAVTWSYDSDSFAVWNVEWRGSAQADAGGGPFPQAQVVYFGRAKERQLIENDSSWISLTSAETEGIADVAFVAYDFGGDVPSVAVTVREAAAGESGDSPVAESRLVLAPTGGFGGPTPEIGAEGSWAGPALYVPQGSETR